MPSVPSVSAFASAATTLASSGARSVLPSGFMRALISITRSRGTSGCGRRENRS